MGDTTKNPQPDAIRAAFIADLEMVHDNLRAAFERVRDQCPEPGGDPFTEGRWEGSFVALRAVLVDELGPMLRAWQEGLQYSRKGEQLCGEGRLMVNLRELADRRSKLERLSMSVCFHPMTSLPGDADLGGVVDVLPDRSPVLPQLVVCRGRHGGLWFLGVTHQSAPTRHVFVCGYAPIGEVSVSIYPSRREYLAILLDPRSTDLDRLVAGRRCLEETERGASLVDEDGEHWSHDNIHTLMTDHGLWGADAPQEEEDDDHDD